MATLTLAGIARHMRKLDICMMVTLSARGVFNSRPMSNNGDVTYKGDSYFFSYEGSQKIKDIEASPQVCLNFEGQKEMYISIAGKAKIIRNRAQMEAHWIEELKRWFKQGLDTPGIVLIHVKGQRLKYWQKSKEGEIKISR